MINSRLGTKIQTLGHELNVVVDYSVDFDAGAVGGFEMMRTAVMSGKCVWICNRIYPDAQRLIILYLPSHEAKPLKTLPGYAQSHVHSLLTSILGLRQIRWLLVDIVHVLAPTVFFLILHVLGLPIMRTVMSL